MQISLALSAITTVWLGLEGAFGFTLIASLVVYGLAVHARQAITQAMVADYAGPEHEDAAYSIYFTVGFISAPLWTLLMGAIMQEAGFTIATQVIAVSYVIGMLLLIPMRIRPKEAQVVAGS
jgi:predicted MFS family arabinose efflux permease